MLLLSHFSRVWLFATSQTVAHQTPLSLGFSRQEYWSGGHTLLQVIFLTQGLNQCLFHLLHWQVGSFSLVLPGKPRIITEKKKKKSRNAYLSNQPNKKYRSDFHCFLISSKYSLLGQFQASNVMSLRRVGKRGTAPYHPLCRYGVENLRSIENGKIW